MPSYSPRRIATAAVSLVFATGLQVFSQSAVKQEGPIQDNSFLVEEAYNQERGVVQHINTFSRMWNSKDWTYTFTQEWPAPHNSRHQFSYTLIGSHAGAFAGSSAGWGDTAFNYRYQLLGDGGSRVAFAPRVSIMLPTGDVTRGRGLGASGIQTNLPFSFVLNRRLVTHWNAGSTFAANAQSADHCRAATLGYSFAQSFVLVVNPRLNFLVETAHNRFQSVTRPGGTEWLSATYLSPGVRWAYNFSSGLQVVPGIAMPVGIGASAGERGLFLYLSFEHPFDGLFSRR
jgi:hypothetical protein